LFSPRKKEAKNKLRTLSAHWWLTATFLVIAAKKKDYHWRIFFSFPFAEERKRQNPKTKKYRVHVR